MEWAHHQIITIWNKMAASCETADAALLYFERKVPHFSVSLFPKCSLNASGSWGCWGSNDGGAEWPDVQAQPTHHPHPRLQPEQLQLMRYLLDFCNVLLEDRNLWPKKGVKLLEQLLKITRWKRYFFIYVKCCKRFALKSKRKDFMLLHKRRNSMYTEVSLLPGSLLNLIS